MIPFAIGAVLRLASKVPRRLTKVPRTLLKAPKSKIPKTYKFKEDMDALGAQIAEEFKETVKRNIVLSHLLFHIGKGHEHTFAPVIRHAVLEGIEYLYPEMRHSYIVCVGKAESKAYIHLAFIFNDSVYLTADIA